MKNRLYAIILSLVCALSLVSCGDEDKSNKQNDSVSISKTETSDKEESTEDISFKEETTINVKQVALGNNYSAAVTENGNLYLWGTNYRGQLGDVSTSAKKVPEGIMGSVKYVSLGYNHSAAITEDGSLYLWGDNKWGQLGDGSTDNKIRPEKIMDNVKYVSLGYEHSAAITEDGSLYVWGRNSAVLKESDATLCKEPVKIMDNVKDVSLGSNLTASSDADNHSAAITEDGQLFMWGDNRSGQLGDGTNNKQHTPVKIMDNVKSVSLGYNHSAAITEDGSLYLWGDNYCGQIGNKSRQNAFKPVKIMENVKEVSLGDRHSAAITEDGNLYLWGDNYLGQLGNYKSGGGSTTFDEGIESDEPIKILSSVKSVSLGNDHSAAILDNGCLYLWGSNDRGQIGSENDRLFTKGYNEYGGFGNNETVYINHPIQIIP